MMERFSGSTVHVHLRKSPMNTKLHNRGKVGDLNDFGMVLIHGENKISFFPWTNVLRIDLITEEIKND